jgi:type II secretory pathway component PulF
MNMEYIDSLFGGSLRNAFIAFKHWRFSNKKQLAFLEDFYLLINDGIPANRAIEMMGEVSIGLNKDVATSLSRKIGEGQPLAEGMSEWFSPNVIEIIRVGEAGGALAQTVKSAIDMLSRQGVAAGAMVGAMAYPLVVIVMACGLIIYLNGSVFEQFKLMKPVEQWPSAGQTLVWLGVVIKYWWWAVIVGIILTGIIIKQVMAKYTGEFRAVLDRYPPFTLYRKLVAARVLETLGLLVANGVVFKAAIGVMQAQASPYMLMHLSRMEHLLSMGKTNIADVLDTGLIDDASLMRLRVMAEVKGFEHGLIRMGVRGAEDATHAMKTIAKVIGGLLLMIGGYLILTIIQGIFSTGMAMGSQA